jgi:hypothetical protein
LKPDEEGAPVKTITLGLVVLAAALAGTSTAASSATGLWPHVYSATITGAPAAPLNATWRISILRTSFATTRNGAAAAAGSVQILGNRITFRDVGGPLACRGAQAVGAYTWRVSGSNLSFARVKDTCVGRRTILAHVFTRVR